MKLWDVIVVGAGPAGSTAARLLSAAGLEVLVLEEHEAVGLPVHCTGIVGEEIFREFAVPRGLIQSVLHRFRVYGPGGRAFDLPRNGRAAAYALDRHALDAGLAEQARAAGAAFAMGRRVHVVDPDDAVVTLSTRTGESWRARLCVLACGAMSNLPARSGLAGPRAFYKTIQAQFSIPGLDGAEIYLSSRFAPGSFGYAVGTPHAAKAGIITRDVAQPGYRTMLASPFLAGRIERALGRDTYRRIPMGAARCSVRGRILSVGDAAGQAKTTTGGGIYYAMLCARILSEVVLRARRGADFHLRSLGAYETAWRRRIGMELQAGLWLRGIFEGVADDEVDRLVAVAASEPIQDVLRQEWDFDFHRHLLVAMARLPEMRRHVLSVAGQTLRARRFVGAALEAVDAYRQVPSAP